MRSGSSGRGWSSGSCCFSRSRSTASRAAGASDALNTRRSGTPVTGRADRTGGGSKMKMQIKSMLAGMAFAASALAATVPAVAQESAYGPADAKFTYYWISNKANLPLFVQYDYAGMKRVAEELGVRVIVAGPT